MKLQPLHILLADDDLDDRFFFEKALKELDIPAQLTKVTDGEQLMEYLTNESTILPQVLFLDINMPRKNGFECLTEIKQNQKLKDLPVVIFSTSKSWDMIDMLFKTGAHVYIHKPNDFSQLKQVIHHALPISIEKLFPGSPIKYVLNA
jgi:CheY-like chemotaxis protein